MLATAKFNYDWDWAGAAKGSEGDAARPRLCHGIPALLLVLERNGKFDESFEQIKKARELEPLSISINTRSGVAAVSGQGV